MKENKEIQNSNPAELSLITNLRQIIEQARSRVAATANYALSIMYWQIGKRINTEVLDNKRAEYGKQIVASVARQLQEEFGKKGFEPRSIWRMMQFAQMFPDIQIVSPMVSKLTGQICATPSHKSEISPTLSDKSVEKSPTLSDKFCLYTNYKIFC